MKKKIRSSLYFLSLISFILTAYLLVTLITEFKPEDEINVCVMDSPSLLNDSAIFGVLLWNIGYGGLDAHMDFFYDGGKHIRPAKENLADNLQQIRKYLNKNADNDFILLQEVDSASKRSYYINEFGLVSYELKHHHASYGTNYQVLYVPVPLFRPLGKTLSGQVTLSKPIPERVVRYAYPDIFKLPKRLYMPDRCFLVNRYNISNGKQLLVINVHNSAMDDIDLKKGQIRLLRDFVIKEYRKGNYIVAGGDWNQCPPDVNEAIPGWQSDIADCIRIEKDLLPEDWSWVFDSAVPTNRRVMEPYDKEKTPVTIIDFFLVSPNVEVISVENLNEEFRYSDHNPVRGLFKL